MTDHDTGSLDYRCETGGCLQVETDGDTTVLYESTQPDIRITTTTASWQARLDQARAEERAAIVGGLREVIISNPNWAGRDGAIFIADLIENAVVDDLAAGDE